MNVGVGNEMNALPDCKGCRFPSAYIYEKDKLIFMALPWVLKKVCATLFQVEVGIME